MILLDTNIFLEILLEQDKAEDATDFISGKQSRDLFMSDFTLHSIGVILFSSRINRKNLFVEFVEDTIIHGGIRVIPLSPLDMESMRSFSRQFNLDFDDAYQYTVCKNYDLELASYDSDFDKTDLTRIEP